MTERIDTVTGRVRLKARREPYWARVEKGAFVGFRKLPVGEGTWIARWRDAERKQHYHALGQHPDYDAAVKAARQWFVQCEGATPKTVTVADAARQYVEERRTRKGELSAKDAEGRFKRHVYDASIGKIELAKLEAAEIEKWLRGLVRKDDEDADAERRSKDSANRDLSDLKAALDLAFRSGLVASDAQWRMVKSFEEVARRRERFLTLPHHAGNQPARFARQGSEGSRIAYPAGGRDDAARAAARSTHWGAARCGQTNGRRW